MLVWLELRVVCLGENAVVDTCLSVFWPDHEVLHGSSQFVLSWSRAVVSSRAYHMDGTLPTIVAHLAMWWQVCSEQHQNNTACQLNHRVLLLLRCNLVGLFSQCIHQLSLVLQVCHDLHCCAKTHGEASSSPKQQRLSRGVHEACTNLTNSWHALHADVRAVVPQVRHD